MGDIILWFILVNLSPAYYVALFGLFIMVFRHLPIRYAVIAAVLLMIATIFEQIDGTVDLFSLTNPVIWMFFFMVLVSIILGFWISNIIEQSTQRQQLIEQLKPPGRNWWLLNDVKASWKNGSGWHERSTIPGPGIFEHHHEFGSC